MSFFNIRRVNKNKVSKATKSGLEIFQNDADDKVYIKDKNGRLVELILSDSEILSNIGSDDSITVTETFDSATLLGGFGAFASSTTVPDGKYPVVEYITAYMDYGGTPYSTGTLTSASIQFLQARSNFDLSLDVFTATQNVMQNLFPKQSGDTVETQYLTGGALFSLSLTGGLGETVTAGNGDLVIVTKYRLVDMIH